MIKKLICSKTRRKALEAETKKTDSEEDRKKTSDKENERDPIEPVRFSVRFSNNCLGF